MNVYQENSITVPKYQLYQKAQNVRNFENSYEYKKAVEEVLKEFEEDELDRLEFRNTSNEQSELLSQLITNRKMEMRCFCTEEPKRNCVIYKLGSAPSKDLVTAVNQLEECWIP